MKGRQIVLDHLNGAEVAALIVDGRLEDLILDAPDRPRTGAVFRAIADRPAKGQGGAFVRLPPDTPGTSGMAFLRGAAGLAPGQPLLVQITAQAEPGKAPPATARLVLKSRCAIASPGAPGINVSRSIRDDEVRARLLSLAHDRAGDGDGLILRSAAEHATDAEVAADIDQVLDLAHALASDATGAGPEALTEGDGPHAYAWREWTAPAAVDTDPGGLSRHGVLDAIAALRGPEALTGGGRLWLEATRALIACDVDTGGDGSHAAGLKANLAAIRALPRALRLRGLGGQIVVDCAPMPKGQRRQVEQAAKAALRACPVETAVVGWTPLGHLELSRKRERAPLPPDLGARP
ncbi:MAG: ribonuclease E/G [Paracoccaceae bacterium]